jgi:hypothetical protein
LREDRDRAAAILNEIGRIVEIPEYIGLPSIPEMVKGLVDDLHKLRQQVTALESTSSGELITAELSEKGGRSDALLDLALDVIAGRVSGLDAARIAALR